jgi:thioredoxin
MKQSEFKSRVKNNPRPLILDIWAPWCMPCRAMAPAFEKTRQKYTGTVDILKINADESPDVLKNLGVMGIPTLIGFYEGKEILRRTGVQSAGQLDFLFDATLHQRIPAIIPPAPATRIFRSAAGLVLMAIGWSLGQSLLLMGIGAVIIFSAFYDRCPIYRAIAPRIKAYFSRTK